MPRVIITLFLLLILAAPNAVQADVSQIGKLFNQSNKQYGAGDRQGAYKSMSQALGILWDNTGFWVDSAILVEKDPRGFGVYTPRANNQYAPEEPIHLYVEPMGYTRRMVEGGIYEFGFTVDFLVLQMDGKVLGGKSNFGQYKFNSHRPNREMFLDLTYTISGAPAGKYRIRTVLHDMVSGATTSVENDIEIVAPPK